MAAAANPLLGLILQRIASMNAGGGPGGMGGGIPPSPDASANNQLSNELANLRQTDPAALMRRIVELKKELGSIMSQTMLSLPGVARSLAKTLSGLDAALKEAQQATATASVVGPDIGSSVVPSGLSTGPEMGIGGV